MPELTRMSIPISTILAAMVGIDQDQSVMAASTSSDRVLLPATVPRANMASSLATVDAIQPMETVALSTTDLQTVMVTTEAAATPKANIVRAHKNGVVLTDKPTITAETQLTRHLIIVRRQRALMVLQTRSTMVQVRAPLTRSNLPTLGGMLSLVRVLCSPSM